MRRAMESIKLESYGNRIHCLGRVCTWKQFYDPAI
jgi:hypothetical protein